LLTIKAEVSDSAGNTTVAQAQVDLAQQSGAAEYSPGGDRGPPTTGMNRSVMSGDRGTTNIDAGFSRGEQWAPDVRTELPLGRGASERRSPVSEPTRPRDPPSVEIGPIEGPALVPPVDGATNPPIGNQYVGRSSEPREALPRENIVARENVPPRSFDYVLPPGEQLRMVNSTAFELDYEVDSVGRSGIAKVELWMTRDGGRTWQNLGADADSRSPFRATVDGEGVYGFRLTVQSGSGLGGRPPQPGELPEVWIGVDLTRPMARLISAETGTGERAGEVAIRYEASDALMANRPITLLQSAQAGGPWTTIAAGLSNTGQFSWRFDETTPERVYLRLEVRDEAGNVATFDASEPVVLERMLPQGRLRDVRPVGVSARLNELPSR
jgi:hypothetical protein